LVPCSKRTNSLVNLVYQNNQTKLISPQDLAKESRILLNKKYSVVDAHNRLMSYKRPSIEEARSKVPSPTESAVLILLYPKQKEWHSILIQRTGYEGVHSKQIAFPGGKRELSDENLEATALREAEEEVSIVPSEVEIIGSLSTLYIPPSNFLVTPYVGISTSEPRLKPDPREVGSIIPFNTKELYREGIIQETELDLPSYDRKMKVKYYAIENHIVWGATGLMLAELSMALRDLLDK
jgi:8-oxo-dGTP pyrophosphatase MutT (NUDIX family)